MTRIALYARVSTSDQHPEVQLAPLREYARRRGAKAVEFVDHAVSGNRRSREGLDGLLKAARRGKLAARRKKRTAPRYRWGGFGRGFRRRSTGWAEKRSPAARLRKRRITRLLNDVTNRVRSGRFNAAYLACRKAITLAPSNVKLRIRWALIQARAGDLTGAMRTIKWLEDRVSQARLRSVLLKVVKLANK